MTIIFCFIYELHVFVVILFYLGLIVLLFSKLKCVRCGSLSAKYGVRRLSTGKICLTCLLENKAGVILLFMWFKWYFHVSVNSGVRME